MRVNEKTNKLVMTAMMTCLIIVATMLFKIPIPGTQGYVHLGDAMIFLSVLVLGWKHGAVAAAVGSAMGDILGGFVAWAPWSLCIKGGMAIIIGLLAAYAVRHHGKALLGVPIAQLLGMVVGGLFMTAGYYLAEGVMYGNWLIAALGIPWNVAQFAVGMALACVLANALCRTEARKFFAYKTAKRTAL